MPGYEVADSAAAAPTRLLLVTMGVIGLAAAWLGVTLEHASHGVPDARVALPWAIPFLLLLGAIAVMPFVARHWWEHNYARVAVALGALVGGYYLLFVVDGPGNVARAVADYISFIFLLASLFIISGGILIRVRARATPAANTAMLMLGAILANVFGTTGASVLLIRPFLRLNAGHIRPFHVVFFIFIVANAGGSLTPIGDPPLFLGYLRGVPFFWVLEHVWPIWLLVNGVLLVVFFAFDSLAARRDARATWQGDDHGPVVSLYGAVNLLLIAGVLAGILLHRDVVEWAEHHLHIGLPFRELVMLGAVLLSLRLTPRRIHVENRFNYAPIKEVAFLFVGIFLTMLPALNYLFHNAGGRFPATPGQYFFVTGGASSVLDNAPTYLTFLKTHLGSLDEQTVGRARAVLERPDHAITPEDLAGLDERQQALLRADVRALMEYHPSELRVGMSDELVRIGFLLRDTEMARFLIAISMGAVLFGAMTYIGNGPNFMVKSIADHAGAKTPSFFGYILFYALPILLPLYIVVWLVFLT